MAINISKTSKLDGVRSWSLQARETCPGAIDQATGDLVPACAGCYAVGGNYRFANVKTPREQNREDWKRDDWVNDMIRALGEWLEWTAPELPRPYRTCHKQRRGCPLQLQTHHRTAHPDRHRSS